MASITTQSPLCPSTSLGSVEKTLFLDQLESRFLCHPRSATHMLSAGTRVTMLVPTSQFIVSSANTLVRLCNLILTTNQSYVREDHDGNPTTTCGNVFLVDFFQSYLMPILDAANITITSTLISHRCRCD